MPYRVKLENFEGPLDLLLFLIRKNEVDIYDIPIAEITQQYLEYLEIIKIFDLEGAGDFIIMAATLIRIKVQMLLPKPQLDEEDEEYVDPRMELVTKLLEYKRFKEVAHKLHDFEDTQRDHFSRSYYDLDGGDEEEEEITFTGEVTLFTLIQAFKSVVERIPKEVFHEVKTLEISTDEQIEYIQKYLTENEQVSFVDLIGHIGNKLVMIVTFVALLELIKRKEIVVKQAVPFGEIWIRKH